MKEQARAKARQPLKAEMGDSRVAGESLHDTGPMITAKKHMLVHLRNDVN
jgi:hypothetical protein